ncbi:hypothetical protein AWM75_08160 [Aerococcus urinaehominis]|uniref:Uncharacterized protein n=1 Tax=Aerococcus urinaehominis TaxID=128944 RepID=A0A0X8FMC2_9LACT|nr:ROK family protein [Aerococcus urinaehominis]AMB99944.1 hypothetical protein AWM75_08160 [Aerococcus urinaehominis]SDM42412.1 Sugar kinase of the NBD/HSP70 family, may contain an N-terminal HTH domain [Aerococcus urinaehominis]
MKEYLAIDVGGTFIKYALVSHDGQVLQSGQRPTPQHLPAFKQTLVDIYQGAPHEVGGIALSIPGRVDTRVGVVHFGGNLTFLDGFAAKAFLTRATGLPVAVINDGKAAALAEQWQGSLKGIDQGLALILGTGLGGGIIAAGHLLQGAHFQAGEVSFMMTDYQQPSEDKAVGKVFSPVATVTAMGQKLGLADPSDGQAVFAAINEGDDRVWADFQAFCHGLAVVIFNCQAIIDLDRVVIGGGISQQPIVAEEIARQYQLVCDQAGIFGQMIAQPEIQACQFVGQSNLLGAVYQLFLDLDAVS